MIWRKIILFFDFKKLVFLYILATAEELNRQKETLLKTEGRLDEINNTLKTSERHLNGIKSVFGGIKNYLFAKNAGLPAPSSQNGSSAGHPKSITQSNSDVSIGMYFFLQYSYDIWYIVDALVDVQFFL